MWAANTLRRAVEEPPKQVPSHRQTPKEEVMGLKLHVEKGDKILMGDDTIITVMSLGSRPQLHFDAPPDVKIIHVHSDPDKQFKNRKKGA